MKIVFVYEHFFPPFDEGVKKLAETVANRLASNHEVRIVRYIRMLPNAINSLLIVPRLVLSRFTVRPDRLVFIPQASLTFSSYVKIFLLQLFFGGTMIVVGTQRRTLKSWQVRMVRKMGLNPMFVLSTAMASDLTAMNIDTTILVVGIDGDRYKPVADPARLRNKYGLDAERRVLLHVGHIRESRNIKWLLDVARTLPHWQVVVVGSTSTERDEDIARQLADAGATVISEYISRIEEIYQLADVYCFPVLLEDAAMETPLSILEAMATNLPVLTTAFGRLPEQFEEDADFRYIANASEIIDTLERGFRDQCRNRDKTRPYTWDMTIERLLEATN